MEKETGAYQFSKEQNQAERDATAVEIRAIRKEKRAENVELGEAYQKEWRVKEALHQIKILEDYLRDLESEDLQKIEDQIQIQSLREDIGERKAETSAGDLTNAQEQLAKLLQTRKYRHDINEARQVLGEFWQGQSEAYAEFQEEERVCQVEAVLDRYDCLVVHAFSPVNVGDNSLLKEGSTAQDKLEVVLAFSPTLSTSTVKVGDDFRNLWSLSGVGIVSGKVLDAAVGDFGTVATGIKERTRYGYQKPEKPSQNINSAINHRGADHYNELIVEDPEVGYVYYCIDDGAEISSPQGTPTVDEMIELAKSNNLPFYFMKNGQLYEAKEDSFIGFGANSKPEQRKEWVQGEPIQHNLIRNNRIKGERANVQEKVIAKHLFRNTEGSGSENVLDNGVEAA